MGNNLTALDENLFVQGDSHRLTGLSLHRCRIDVERFDGLDVGGFIRW